MEFLGDLGYRFTKMGRGRVSFLIATTPRFEGLIVVKISTGEVRTHGLTLDYEVIKEEPSESIPAHICLLGRY